MGKVGKGKDAEIPSTAIPNYTTINNKFLRQVLREESKIVTVALRKRRTSLI
jgi:hypothetical protein